MTTRLPEIELELESRVADLAMEVVELQWAGNKRRPILRLRIDHVDPGPESGVTVDDCARVSRELEAWLDEHPSLSERYVLEVSSPGVERPLHRKQDFERFRGEEVALKLREPLEGRNQSRVEGILAEVEGLDDSYRVVLDLQDGSTVRVGRDQIVKANLVFRWDGR